MKCSGRCNDCIVRFRCYTEPVFYPMIVTRKEWLIERLRVDGEDGESHQSVKLATSWSV